MKISKIPEYGDKGTHVSEFQRALLAKGFSPGSIDGVFGPKTKAACSLFQKSIGLPGSGIPGERTMAGLGLEVAPSTPVVTLPLDLSQYFGAPWIGANIDLLGRHETDKELNERYVPEWKLEGLPGYKTLSGNSYAWCSLKVNADLRKVGIKGTNSAGAASWSSWGKSCDFWFGAVLPIKHKSGGRHVCFFLYWFDESKKIAATMDGNRSNLFCIAATDLSGKGDTLSPSPRWAATGVPDGKCISMNEALSKYPHLKVGSVVGDGTR